MVRGGTIEYGRRRHNAIGKVFLLSVEHVLDPGLGLRQVQHGVADSLPHADMVAGKAGKVVENHLVSQSVIPAVAIGPCS